jgi:hypothetical protein
MLPVSSFNNSNIYKTNFETATQKNKRGRPRKQGPESVANKQQDEGHKGLKRTRFQQKSFSSTSDPFSALNMMPSMTPKSPKKDRSGVTSNIYISNKGKDSKLVQNISIPLTLQGQGLKEKACHQKHSPNLKTADRK